MEIADDARRTELFQNYPEAIQISAKENIGMERLRKDFRDPLERWTERRTAREAEEKERAEAAWPEE